MLLSIDEMQPMAGYLPGLRSYSLLTEMRIDRGFVTTELLSAIDKELEALFPLLDTRVQDSVKHQRPLISRIFNSIELILRESKRPDLGPIQLRAISEKGVRVAFAVPAVGDGFSAERSAVTFAVNLLNRMSSGIFTQGLKTDLESCCQKIKAGGLQGVNTSRFLSAAFHLGIPFRHCYGNVFQFGWGGRGQFWDSSLTNYASGLGVAAARDKLRGAEILRRAGLPVPQHQAVDSLQAAVSAAEVLGYPVVLKPINLDGGKGVFPGIRNKTSLVEIYSNLSRLTKRVLVEKHFEANDYRLQVHCEELFWAVKREPAAVIGDGKLSVSDLIDRANQAVDPSSYLVTNQGRARPVVIDSEVERWLASQNLSLADVPTEGQCVRLKGVANVTHGATVVKVLDEVHPDNAQLAEDAARILGLDLAGVDLLISDIAVSWKESGAVICEVNAQPQIAPGLQSKVLLKAFKGGSRVPIVAVVGLEPERLLGLIEPLLDHPASLASVYDSVLYIGGQSAFVGSSNNDAGSVALCRPEVSAVALLFSDMQELASANCFDLLNVLVVNQDQLHSKLTGRVLLDQISADKKFVFTAGYDNAETESDYKTKSQLHEVANTLAAALNGYGEMRES